jgi:hypothetical protein
MLDRFICGLKLNKIIPFRNTCNVINHDDIIFKEPLVLPDLLIIFKKIRKKKRLRVKRKVHSY